MEQLAKQLSCQQAKARPHVPEVLALEDRQLAPQPSVDSPLAHAPVTSAPADDPDSRSGRRFSSSSTDSTPACAKNPKNPDDIVRVNGLAFSHLLSVVIARA
jgi:hypothetical protein